MLRCGNIILLTVRLFDVTKLTTLTPLSLLILCKLSFPIVDLKTALLSLSNKIFLCYFENLSNICSTSS
jgi:hypothetical protein